MGVLDAPAFHTEHAPSSFYPREARPGHLALEARFPAATVEELRRRGHQLEVVDDWSLGRVTAARSDGTHRVKNSTARSSCASNSAR